MALFEGSREAAPLLLVTSWALCVLLLYGVVLPPWCHLSHFWKQNITVAMDTPASTGTHLDREGLSPLQPQCCGCAQSAGWPVTAPHPQINLVGYNGDAHVVQKWFDKMGIPDHLTRLLRNLYVG